MKFQVLPVITEQPQQLTGVKLHNYQINAINWMVSTEQDADNSKSYSAVLSGCVSPIQIRGSDRTLCRLNTATTVFNTNTDIV